MDLTSKIPFHRDWENFSLFSRKEGEISKPAQRCEWEVVDNHGSYGNGNGSVYSSVGGLGPGSDLGNGSSRSSISSSIGFPSKAGTGALRFIIDSVEKPPEILKVNKDLAMVETGILHKVVAVEGPKEPRTQLKLGKRTYFEGGIHSTNSSLASTNPSIGLVKKPKVSQQNMQSSHCQVEGCHVDLSAVKDYHRKHRVCEGHSKFPKVIVAGQTCRFCQQCSRFHDLSEFDQKKRSCRRRLFDHNARRRKPQPETIKFGSSVFSASYYGTDDRQQMNLMFGRHPFNHVTNMANSTWDDSGGFKLIPSQGPWINFGKSGDINEQLHFPSNGISKNVSIVNHDWDGLLPFKGTNAEATNKGPGAPVFASNLDGALDLQRALSLLSTESVPYQEPISDFQSVNANIITSHSAIHPTNATTVSWQKTELLLPRPSPFNLQNHVSQI